MSCSCGIELVSGAPEETGGGAAEFATVALIDFVAADAAIGDQNLNVLNSSFTYHGVTWITPTAARTGSNMLTTSTSFGLVATGIRIVGAAAGTGYNPPTVPCILAPLADIAAGYNFTWDPTKDYLIQSLITERSYGGVNDLVMLQIYKLNTVPVGGAATALTALAQQAAGVDDPEFFGGGASPAVFSRDDLAGNNYDIPGIYYNRTGHCIDGYVTKSVAGDYPDPSGTLEFIASFASNAALTQDVPMVYPATDLLGVGGGGYGTGADYTIASIRIMER